MPAYSVDTDLGAKIYLNWGMEGIHAHSEGVLNFTVEFKNTDIYTNYHNFSNKSSAERGNICPLGLLV